MALLGESHHPCPLLLCLRHRVSSGLAQPVKRLVWRKTGEHQKACGHENSSADSLIAAERSFLCKVELAHFSGSQQRNQDVNTSLTKGLDLIEQPVTTSWTGHDADLSCKKSLNGIQLCTHDQISFSRFTSGEFSPHQHI